MSKHPVKVGIIGAGFIGRSHARAVKENENALLVAVADISTPAGHGVVSDYGGTFYQDYNKMLATENLDAVIICTPDHLHLEPTIAVAKAGKDILLEKPLASTMEDAEGILKAVSENKVRLMVGHCLRFSPQYAYVKECVGRGDIGEPVHGWARRNAKITDGRRFKGNTSVVLFLGVHDIDFLRWCIGSEVVRVYAEKNQKVLKNTEMADSILSVLKFKNGFVASLEHSWINPENFGAVVDQKIEFVGEKGSVSFDGYNQGLNVWTGSGGRFGGAMEYFGQLRGSIYEQDKHFIECLQQGREFLISGEEARKTLRVALAIHESLKNEKPVSLD
jgi:predicted dehydrogenase